MFIFAFVSFALGDRSKNYCFDLCQRVFCLCFLLGVSWFPILRTIALISHTSKVMLKNLQARLQQYVNCELPDVQAGFTQLFGASLVAQTVKNPPAMWENWVQSLGREDPLARNSGPLHGSGGWAASVINGFLKSQDRFRV